MKASLLTHLNQEFNAALQGVQTLHEPVAISSWDKTQFVSLLRMAGDRTSKRDVYQRTVLPNGAGVTSWVEVLDEIKPWG